MLEYSPCKGHSTFKKLHVASYHWLCVRASETSLVVYFLVYLRNMGDYHFQNSPITTYTLQTMTRATSPNVGKSF